jgi:hypothetical protein
MQKLDLAVLYLAQVHLYEYYSGVQHASIGEMLDTWRPYSRPTYTGPEATLRSLPSNVSTGTTDAASAEVSGLDSAAIDTPVAGDAKEDTGSDSDAEGDRCRVLLLAHCESR